MRTTKNKTKRSRATTRQSNPTEAKSSRAVKRYRARQPSLFESVHVAEANTEANADSLKKEWRKLSRRTHGGATFGESGTSGVRKEFRPLDKTKWTHLILKSDKAKGRFGFLTPRNQLFIANLLKKKSLKFGITIQSQANVGNHLHLKIRFKTRQGFQDFLRSVTSLIARFVTGAKKGKPFGRFWQGLAYTRVVTTKKEELQLRGYIEANRVEAARGKSAREKYLDDFNRWIDSFRGSPDG